MSPSADRVRALIAEEAAGWFIANRAGPTSKDYGAFIAWLRESPVHVEEYLRLAALARDLPRACELSDDSLTQLIEEARIDESAPVEPLRPLTPTREEGARFLQRRRHAVALAAAVVLAVSFLLYLHRYRSMAPSTPVLAALNFATGHGEQRSQVLADGSILHLNTDSSIELRYTEVERRFDLLAGEALFELVHEPKRPFRVQAPGARIVAMGTSFDVRVQKDSTIVIVTEGRVRIEPGSEAGPRGRGPGAGALELGAGQEAVITSSTWPPVTRQADVERATAWLHRQISFDHETLQRVAEEFSRYSAKPIVITAPELRNLEITGVFSTDDVEAFVAFLRSLEGAQVDVSDTRIEVSLRKPPRREHSR